MDYFENEKRKLNIFKSEPSEPTIVRYRLPCQPLLVFGAVLIIQMKPFYMLHFYFILLL